MEVYLIRHGIAGDRNDYPTDEERPLTDKGKSKTRKVAQRLKTLGLQFDLILTSPLRRAQQTATILQEVGLSPTVEEFAPLTTRATLL
ncbi:MAG: phosphohistidine phosphatase SixA [Kamptonema sp. SIO4C4]|nr:phosphohistidine phosphatase SixA [Kamptonema sp. SIO4C4]